VNDRDLYLLRAEIFSSRIVIWFVNRHPGYIPGSRLGSSRFPMDDLRWAGTVELIAGSSHKVHRATRHNYRLVVPAQGSDRLRLRYPQLLIPEKQQEGEGHP